MGLLNYLVGLKVEERIGLLPGWFPGKMQMQRLDIKMVWQITFMSTCHQCIQQKGPWRILMFWIQTVDFTRPNKEGTNSCLEELNSGLCPKKCSAFFALSRSVTLWTAAVMWEAFSIIRIFTLPALAEFLPKQRFLPLAKFQKSALLTVLRADLL